MFGYHDSPKCSFDIWSSNPTRWGNNAIENRAFSPYCKHMQECDDIVKAILNGQTDFTLDDHFNESDLNYISAELRKFGIEAELTLD